MCSLADCFLAYVMGFLVNRNNAWLVIKLTPNGILFSCLFMSDPELVGTGGSLPDPYSPE